MFSLSPKYVVHNILMCTNLNNPLCLSRITFGMFYFILRNALAPKRKGQGKYLMLRIRSTLVQLHPQTHNCKLPPSKQLSLWEKGAMKAQKLPIHASSPRCLTQLPIHAFSPRCLTHHYVLPVSGSLIDYWVLQVLWVLHHLLRKRSIQ